MGQGALLSSSMNAWNIHKRPARRYSCGRENCRGRSRWDAAAPRRRSTVRSAVRVACVCNSSSSSVPLRFLCRRPRRSLARGFEARLHRTSAGRSFPGRTAGDPVQWRVRCAWQRRRSVRSHPLSPPTLHATERTVAPAYRDRDARRPAGFAPRGGGVGRRSDRPIGGPLILVARRPGASMIESRASQRVFRRCSGRGVHSGHLTVSARRRPEKSQVVP